MNDLQIFKSKQFGEIRTLEENGKPLFCGSDVAKALGYAIPSKAVNQHCKGVSKMEVPTNGGIQQMLFISEGDVYRLISHSKLPAAEKFEHWVFDEVLPTIRKHGAYIMPDTLDQMISSPDFGIKLLSALKEEKEKVLVLEQRVAEFQPIEEYVDTILKSPGTLTTTQIAADYGLSARKLNRILHEERIQRFVGNQWILYRKHMNLGYTKSETIHFNHSDGTPDTTMQTKWTQKGRLMIHEVLKKRGIMANMDKSLDEAN